MIIRSRPAGNSGVFVCVFVFVPYPDTIRACVRITLPSTLIQFVCLCVCFSVFSLVEYPDTIAIDGLPGCYCQERCDEMDCDGQTIITLTDVNEIPQNGSAPMLTTLSDCGADFREFLSGGAGPLRWRYISPLPNPPLCVYLICATPLAAVNHLAYVCVFMRTTHTVSV